MTHGEIELLGDDVWLAPSGVRPDFDVPRFWSNPGLHDPLTISALVARNPTIRDVTRVVLAYGTTPATEAIANMVADGDMRPTIAERARRMIESVRGALMAVAWAGPPATPANPTLPTGFEPTCRGFGMRRTAQDIYDIWTYLADGATIERISAIVIEANPHLTDDIVVGLLTPGSQVVWDAGFVPDRAGAPKDFPTLREAIAVHVDGFHQRIAAAVAIEEGRNGLIVSASRPQPTFRPS